MFLIQEDLDEICKDLPEVSTPKIFESGKFSGAGLFSQQIFGPVKSYSCACRRFTYRGRTNRDSKCKVCDVDITSSDERRKRYGKISLPFPVLNPLFLDIILLRKPSLKKTIMDILLHNKYYIDGNKIKKLKEGESVENKNDLLFGLDGIYKLIEFLFDEDDPVYQYIRDNYNKIAIHNVLVIPPDFRPCTNSKNGINMADEINSIYSSIIIRSNHAKNLTFAPSANPEIFKNYYKHVQTEVFELHDHILTKMSKKKGLIRSNILGKRVDFSGRGVISPDPTLSLNQCKVPYWMILEMLKPQLVSYFVSRRICKRYNQAVKLIDDCIANKSTDLFDIVAEFCKGKMCVLNRQPTLHRVSILAFDFDIHLGNTIQIHPLVCVPYNADFDGDAMAIYCGVTDKSHADIKNKLGILNNLISQTDMTLIPQPNQDIILGIYAITQ